MARATSHFKKKKEKPQPRTIETVIHTKAKGVTFRNKDGSHRQDVIKKRCKTGLSLSLIPEPDNPRDENAIAIYCSGSGVFGKARRAQIGYLDASLAKLLNGDVKNGLVTAEITKVTGSWLGCLLGRSRGVNIKLIKKEKADPI